MRSKLFIISLPIGNLEDITLRAISTLKSVDLILCEDTREFIKIAKTYEIHTRYESFHDFNEEHKSKQIIEKLKKGENIAIVSDRGTPTISDPGFILIKKYTEFLNYKISGFIVPIPGVSSVLTAQSLCIFDSKFLFFGFAENKHLDNLISVQFPIVFFESPHRINDFLEKCYEKFGNRKIFIAKEMTKFYESFEYGELKNYRINDPKGEFVVIVEGNKKSRNVIEIEKICKEIKNENLNVSNKDLSVILSKIFMVEKKEIYQILNN